MSATSGSAGNLDRSGRDWSLSDQVYEQILRLIVDGQFPEGSKLPPETRLSEDLGVSRPVLRQALKQLRDDGVITSRQGSGSYVQRRPDRAMLSFAPVGSIADVQRTFEFRAVIESDAAALAAERWTDEDMARIDAAMVALETCIREGALGADADEELHLAICAATDNHYFVSARSSMKSQIITGMNLARSLSLTKPVARLELVQAEHRGIVAAIRKRDAEAARHLMKAHVDNARQRVFEGEDSA
ncbi:FadR/GntR family transcriptional regulator [Oceanomicrobium pacificus]|uniref:FCD domain-containing protein n=1 Tax=Oceanomicrobium pacificus TaxID=2692916 RepID=A0A6B0TR51_9RHOB|nr:FadR/GntR family transcriptional regulator [Oceanomicrobium pacificus]MXU65169.1 FCD domain-containing protein [Oceanomicrobium pacificus]